MSSVDLFNLPYPASLHILFTESVNSSSLEKPHVDLLTTPLNTCVYIHICHLQTLTQLLL